MDDLTFEKLKERFRAGSSLTGHRLSLKQFIELKQIVYKQWALIPISAQEQEKCEWYCAIVLCNKLSPQDRRLVSHNLSKIRITATQFSIISCFPKITKI